PSANPKLLRRLSHYLVIMVTIGGIMSAPRARGALLLGSLLTAFAAFAAACGGSSGSEPITQPSTAPAAVTVVSGNGQTGLVGTALSLPLVVKVTTTSG